MFEGTHFAYCWGACDSCTSQFARVVKGVDLRSTAGNCAWARTPQLTCNQEADIHVNTYTMSCSGATLSMELPCWPRALRSGADFRRGCRLLR